MRLAHSFNTLAAAALGVTVAAAPTAANPSRLWWGVERIVVACDFDASVTDPELRSDLCADIVAAVRARTPYPVASSTELTDRDPVSELLLKVSASQPTRGAVQLLVQPHRFGLMTKAPPSLVSSVQGPANDRAALMRLIDQSLKKIFP